MRFVDTNVLLYAISRTPDEEPKARIARELLNDTALGMSTQVLQEFYVQATRASRAHRLTHDQADSLVEAFTRFAIQGITVPVVRAAMTTSERFGLSYWDSAIIEAARALGCREVLSEDLADGGDYSGVRVTNPFGPIAQVSST